LGLKPVPAIKYRNLESLEREVAGLVSQFSALAGTTGASVKAAKEYREHTGRELPEIAAGLDFVAQALVEMDAATPLVKQQILRLCGLVATEDGVVGDNEQELLRATAEAIGAPIPPLFRLQQ
jgi:hypothetical protein